MREEINRMLLTLTRTIDKSRILFILKFFIFFTLIYTAIVMYSVRNIYLANDLIMMAALFIILNKLDNI